MDRPSLAQLPGRRRVGPRHYERFVPLLAELADGDGAALLPDPSDPKRFVEAACFHGLAGQVLTGLRAQRLRLPAEHIEVIEVAQAALMVRAVLLRAELRRIGPVIAAACGTAPVLIKGPALADRFYATPEFRPFVDLDLIVPLDELPSAVEALTSASGYTVVSQRWPASLERHGHAVELCRELGAHSLELELHWRISDDPLAAPLDHARLASGSVALPGAPGVLVPGFSEQILVVALHILHHSERRLIWLLDLVAVGRAASEAQWRAAFELADGLGLAWVLHEALDLCAGHLRFDRTRPAASAWGRDWGPLRAAQAIGGPVGYHFGHLATLGWTERLEYLATGTRGRLERAARALMTKRF
ncbi:MAG: nucleotidyltransferase family protein [Solirubrobacteraceae bacterium]